ncbi:GDSL-type esterase/lipase family protein [Aeromonas media]|uniref:GDSL-type esterase/lipase family protein n=1 Tax=Aeromonas media TaxID=651 RepID=A0AAW5RJ17_AERME|nr:GDSL-type esterase/lipase family protein [Aeromonas media]MCV3286679.1 GDSL-type esterase/lipase family protein [Aeromonas media]WOQ12172.1 GDSL-type esterase/lipase family protein [Aeromonas media]BBS88122.1 arylesterase [Aeromonas media]
MHREGLVRRCVTGLLCLLLAACGEPGFRPLAAGETILAFGDSLTEGRGVNPAQSYPSVLASLSGHPVINGGVSGELSRAGRTRLPSLLAEHRPALVILLEGGNDILRGSGEGALKANLAAMIEAVQGSGAQVLLVAVPRKSLFADGAPLYGELAEQYGLVLDNDSLGELLRTPGLKSDAVHLNAQGYGALAERLHRLLQARGAL